MGLRDFMDVRNSSFMSLLILGVVVIFVVLIESFPQYQGYLAWGIFPAIIGIPIGLQLNARFQGPPHPHIEHSIFDGITGIAYHIEDFFIDFFDPAEKVPDVYPMMKPDPATGKLRPVYFGGRWWYPYLTRVKWPISFADFENCFLFIFVLPRPWDAFMMFGRRPQGAFAQTEIIDHGTSTHVDSIIAPFSADHLGVKIPIFLSVFSRSSVLMITKSWKEEMTELARYIKVMDDLIIDVQDSIFPMKELEEIAKTEFPMILKQYGAKKKIERKTSVSA